LLGFHIQALMLQGKFEFHKNLKVIRCCLGSPGKSGEAHPHPGPRLAQPFVIKLKLHSCCIPFECFGLQKKSCIYDLKK